MFKILKRRSMRTGFISYLGFYVLLLIVATLTFFTIQNPDTITDLVMSNMYSFCALHNIPDTLKSIGIDGTYKRLSIPSSTVLNVWYPAISDEKLFAHLCDSSDGDTDLLLLITSGTTAKHADQRQLVRSTWLNVTTDPDNVKHIFLLGLSTNAYENKVILDESNKYKDILILNFIDSYQNLTLKTMSSLKWVASNCKRVKLVMKTDVDVFVNIPRILNFLKKHQSTLHNTIFGRCYRYPTVERRETKKTQISEEEYSLYRYPLYCSGSGYIMSMNTLRDVVKVSHFMPKLTMEDAYVGMCAYCIGKKFSSHYPDFGSNYKDVLKVAKEPMDLFSYNTIHKVPEEVLEYMWLLYNTEKP